MYVKRRGPGWEEIGGTHHFEMFLLKLRVHDMSLVLGWQKIYHLRILPHLGEYFRGQLVYLERNPRRPNTS